MVILSKEEIDGLINQSLLAKKYNQSIDRESAYEILTAKLEKLSQQTEQSSQSTNNESKSSSSKVSQSAESTFMKSVIKLVTSATFIRGIFNLLNKILSGSSKSRRR